MPLGIYISVPFCRTKCTFCNFASGIFSRELFDRYIKQVTGEIAHADALAKSFGGEFHRAADSIYLGGGTPSVLTPEQLAALFHAVRDRFDVSADAEITVECAPGTLNPEIIASLVACGVNRVSLGVQSFVDQESRAVGRLHTREITLQDIAHLRAAGIHDMGIDLIAGLPHQTADSWRYSVEETLATEVPHVSVYMLEVDEDSRLGRELIAGGTRYHAHHVPDDDMTADLYLVACNVLNAGGVRQYEISNFARGELCEGLPQHASLHNLKYWLRQPYLGFGVDAHSMLSAPQRGEPHAAIRFATTDDLDKLLSGTPHSRIEVDERNAIEEAWFLGLRLNRGVELLQVHEEFGIDAVERYREPITDLVEAGLLAVEDGFVRLTDRGRLLSNEVFGRFIEPCSESADAKEKGPKITIV
jgi:oxygen-independent coproporphyrinogen III oxidase